MTSQVEIDYCAEAARELHDHIATVEPITDATAAWFHATAGADPCRVCEVIAERIRAERHAVALLAGKLYEDREYNAELVRERDACIAELAHHDARRPCAAIGCNLTLREHARRQVGLTHDFQESR